MDAITPSGTEGIICDPSCLRLPIARPVRILEHTRSAQTSFSLGLVICRGDHGSPPLHGNDDSIEIAKKMT
jgi:hypothetical protein